MAITSKEEKLQASTSKTMLRRTITTRKSCDDDIELGPLFVFEHMLIAFHISILCLPVDAPGTFISLSPWDPFDENEAKNGEHVFILTQHIRIFTSRI